MLKLLWNYLEKKSWKGYTKYRTFFIILTVLAGVVGYCIWLVVSMFALKTIDWMLCFIGYPTLLSWFIGYLYVCNHEFS